MKNQIEKGKIKIKLIEREIKKFENKKKRV